MPLPPHRIVLHVDMNYFFAAVEERDRPELKGKPVVVGADPKGGRGRGVVATCNYTARAFGVRSGMPISRAWKLCPTCVYLPVDFERYLQASEQVMGILQRFAGVFEPAGVDEAFLDVSGRCKSFGEAEGLAEQIQQAVLEQTKLPCSVGVAPNKLVAKIASNQKKPLGITVVPPERVRAFLDPLPVKELWGVGPKMDAWLARQSVSTVGRLRQADPVALVESLGEWGGQLYRYAHGLDESPVSAGWAAKSLGREHTFSRDVAEPGLVLKKLAELAREMAGEVRAGRWRFKTIVIRVRFAGFETHTAQKRVPATNDEEVLLQTARRLLAPFLRGGRNIRLVSVRVKDLVPDWGQTRLAEFMGA